MSDDNKPSSGNDSGEDNQLWNLLQGKNAPDDATATRQDKSPKRTPDDAAAKRKPPVTPPVPGKDVPQFSENDIPDGFAPDLWQASRDEEVSSLQKVLSNPDAADELDLTSTRSTRDDELTGDIDAAVSSFYREEKVDVMCRKFPDEVATTQCPECQAFFSQKAMTVKRGKLLCVDCAEAVFVKSESEILDAQERGYDENETEVTAVEHPPFEIGSTRFGQEGRPSHPVKKLVALLLDFMITRMIILIVLFIIGGSGAHSSGLFAIFSDDVGGTQMSRIVDAFLLLKPIPYWLILFAISDYLYYFLSLAFWNRTIGMSWTGIRIVTEWGEFASFSALLMRTLIFIVLFEAPAVLLSLFFPAFRGLHDYAAGTVVVNYSGIKRVDAYETIQIKLN